MSCLLALVASLPCRWLLVHFLLFIACLFVSHFCSCSVTGVGSLNNRKTEIEASALHTCEVLLSDGGADSRFCLIHLIHMDSFLSRLDLCQSCFDCTGSKRWLLDSFSSTPSSSCPSVAAGGSGEVLIDNTEKRKARKQRRQMMGMGSSVAASSEDEEKSVNGKHGEEEEGRAASAPASAAEEQQQQQRRIPLKSLKQKRRKAMCSLADQEIELRNEQQRCVLENGLN